MLEATMSHQELIQAEATIAQQAAQMLEAIMAQQAAQMLEAIMAQQAPRIAHLIFKVSHRNRKKALSRQISKFLKAHFTPRCPFE